jgi:multidrug resistance efflux pump
MQRILFIALAPLCLLMACKQNKNEVRPQMRQLTEAVYASGTMVPAVEYKVVSSIDGFLEKALVKEGDSVKKDQLLFTLHNSNQEAQVAAASRMVAKTAPVTAPDAPAIKDVESRLASANIRLQNDRLQYERYKNLYEQNAISASGYEKFKLQFETTQQEVQSLQEQLKQQRLSAGLQLQEARNQLQIAQTSRSNESLKSYTDGVVYDVYKQTGDLITPGQAVALVGSGDMIARLLVDEDDLGKVKEGQKVLISLDAYPGKIFQAQVQKIYPLLNKQEQSFRVDAIMRNDIPKQLYGLNVEANIVIRENVNALVIPKNALLKGDSVLVKQNGKKVKIKVRPGIEDKEYVQILEGIDLNSILIIE